MDGGRDQPLEGRIVPKTPNIMLRSTKLVESHISVMGKQKTKTKLGGWIATRGQGRAPERNTSPQK